MFLSSYPTNSTLESSPRSGLNAVATTSQELPIPRVPSHAITCTNGPLGRRNLRPPHPLHKGWKGRLQRHPILRPPNRRPHRSDQALRHRPQPRRRHSRWHRPRPRWWRNRVPRRCPRGRIPCHHIHQVTQQTMLLWTSSLR